MGFDETYDQMLRREFGSGAEGPSALEVAPAPIAPVAPVVPSVPETLAVPEVLGAPDVAVAVEVEVDEEVDVAALLVQAPAFVWPAAPSPEPEVPTAVPGISPIHEEFRSHEAVAVSEEASTQSEGPRGLSRYRNAAMVGAGGLACAAVGAFLGGLGGTFSIDPAAAHPVVSASGPEQQLADAVNQAHGLGGARSVNDALGTATLASLTGSLTQGSSPFHGLTASG
ncbi:MAG TPA: hypothetical protein VHD39_00280, partial [Acidimicrobiales bacterium]|nr:hypothetical protein [Acidimicrobiales bacterium]